jgi:uroporphyrinogen-III synthase
VNRTVLILRPEPGAGESARRATSLGLDPVVAPLFKVEPLGWEPPDASAFDAILLTSANAVRQGGAGLTRYTHLPCFAVGETSAKAARAAGFTQVLAGPSDIQALLPEIARHLPSSPRLAEGTEIRLLHLCGRDHVAAQQPGLMITRIPVYAAQAVAVLPEAAREAAEAGALALIHSPRAAELFRALLDDAGLERAKVALATISAAAAERAGPGWKSITAAEAPRDAALLELAARLLDVKVP